jgi:ubiquinone/menaquinone biosynthesis C-methylase UbiE
MHTESNLIDLYENKVYQNAGNSSLLALIPSHVETVLDIGCGAGDNARLLKERGCRVWGVTISEQEASIASKYMEAVLVQNVELSDLDLPYDFFDLLLFSHVLEHMIRPENVLNRLTPHLKREGLALIAVPNMANYRSRFRLLLGNWRREESGPFDRTHYHFWSYETIDVLFAGCNLQPIKKVPGDPSVPLWPLRRILSRRLLQPLDHLGGWLFPNLFAGQVIVVARRV